MKDVKAKKAEVQKTTKTTKSKISELASRTRKTVSPMLEKGSEAMMHVSAAISKFRKANAKPLDIAEGVMSIASAIAAFLPPPASSITDIVSGNFTLQYWISKNVKLKKESN